MPIERHFKKTYEEHHTEKITKLGVYQLFVIDHPTIEDCSNDKLCTDLDSYYCLVHYQIGPVAVPNAIPPATPAVRAIG